MSQKRLIITLVLLVGVIAAVASAPDFWNRSLLRNPSRLLQALATHRHAPSEGNQVDYGDLLNAPEGGEQGPPGPKGDKGDTGSQGIQGYQGLPGNDGAAGAPGTPGSPGAKGDPGDTGTPGTPGVDGEDGSQGVPGNDGAPGSPGSPGAKGDKGDQGNQGIQGIQGVPGDPGISTARVTGSNVTTTGQALVNITGLSLALLANSVYEFEGCLTVQSSSTAGNGYGVNFSAAGAAVEAQIGGTLAAATQMTKRINALNTSAQAFVTVAATGGVRIKGIMTIGANPGNLTVSHLKVTSGTSTVFINSFLTARKIV